MIVFLIIVLAVLFLLFMPIAAKIGYDGNFTVRAGIFFPFLKVFPLKKKEKKKKKKRNNRPKKKDNHKEKGSKKEKVKLDRKMIFGLIKRFPGYFKRLLAIREIRLSAVLGNEDPGDLALTYGGMNVALESAAAILSPLYPAEKWKVRLEADFEREKSEIDGVLRCRTNLFRILAVLISFGIYVIMHDSDEKGDVENG